MYLITSFKDIDLSLFCQALCFQNPRMKEPQQSSSNILMPFNKLHLASEQISLAIFQVSGYLKFNIDKIA
jgi:hypothetical protein